MGWGPIGSVVKHARHFLHDHWKQIVTIAAATAVGVLVTVATGGAGLALLPALGAAAAGGLAGGATYYTVDHFLSHPEQRWSWSDFVKTTLVSGALAVPTAGLGNWAAPSMTSALDGVVPELVAKAATNATIGAGASAATKVGENAYMDVVHHKDRGLLDGASGAAANGAFAGLVATGVSSVAANAGARGADSEPHESESAGMAGAVEGLASEGGVAEAEGGSADTGQTGSSSKKGKKPAPTTRPEPATTAPATTAPTTTAPTTTAPTTTAPATTAPTTTAPTTTAPTTTAPTTTAPTTTAPTTTAPAPSPTPNPILDLPFGE